jgi:predicted Holliday junction resolvase-like endonuclease
VIDIAKDEEGDDSFPSLRKATSKLINHVEECIRKIEAGRDRKVEQFYIGKTLTHRRKRRHFHRMKSSTWKLSKGISKRFKKHHGNGYGRDGMVVLTVVSRKAVPHFIR